MNDQSQQLLESLVSKMGFTDFSVTPAQDTRRYTVFINDAPYVTRHLSQIISDLDFLFKAMLRKQGLEIAFVDINNYRKEREDIIVKLAKAAAKKCSVTQKEVALPPMNSFERRIVHTELSVHPDVVTESRGEGKQRMVVIAPFK